MAGLVVGGQRALFLGEHHAARDAEDDLLQRVGKVRHLHLLVLTARGQQGPLVAEIGKIGADHSRSRGGDAAEVDFGVEWQ